MRRVTIGSVLLFLVLPPTLACGQFKEDETATGGLGPSRVQRWKAGFIVKAVSAPCRGIVGYMPVPAQWPEQTVRVAHEEISPSVKLSYQTVDEYSKVMVVRIAILQANEEAKALVTFEISRSAQLPPADTSLFSLPDAKTLAHGVRQYLAPSPEIESRNAKIRRLAKEIGVDKEKAWDKVEAIYDWARKKVEYKAGMPLKGAATALRDGSGGHEDLTGLFIALCRANDIPARTVWVPEHCYAEFYLIDKKGAGHWFPCEAAGTRAFGEMPDTKLILQKGDNFRPPYNPKDHQRFMAERLTGAQAANGARPTITAVHELAN
ncbi:MAG: transglutaminase domain-containing protein [Thermoguttaceae bacterium]|jgi:hypothetical protein